jgi:hypothetical protein
MPEEAFDHFILITTDFLRCHFDAIGKLLSMKYHHLLGDGSSLMLQESCDCPNQ